MNKNQELIDNLRAAADYLESHRIDKEFNGATIYCFAHEAEEFSKLARQLGSFDKDATLDWFNLNKTFGTGCGKDITLQITVKRDIVCEKFVTQRVVPAEPEKIIPEAVIPAKPERVVELVEWVCPESVLSLAEAR